MNGVAQLLNILIEIEQELGQEKPNRKRVLELADEGAALFSSLGFVIELLETMDSLSIQPCMDPSCPVHGPAQMN